MPDPNLQAEAWVINKIYLTSCNATPLENPQIWTNSIWISCKHKKNHWSSEKIIVIPKTIIRNILNGINWKKKPFYNSCLCEAKIPGTKNDLFLSAMKQRIGMILHVWYSTKYLLFNLLFLLLITRKSHYFNLKIKQVFRHL